MGAVLACQFFGFQCCVEATPNQRTKYEIAVAELHCTGRSLNEDLSVAGLLAGADWQGA